MGNGKGLQADSKFCSHPAEEFPPGSLPTNFPSQHSFFIPKKNYLNLYFSIGGKKSEFLFKKSIFKEKKTTNHQTQSQQPPSNLLTFFPHSGPSCIPVSSGFGILKDFIDTKPAPHSQMVKHLLKSRVGGLEIIPREFSFPSSPALLLSHKFLFHHCWGLDFSFCWVSWEYFLFQQPWEKAQ